MTPEILTDAEWEQLQAAVDVIAVDTAARLAELSIVCEQTLEAMVAQFIAAVDEASVRALLIEYDTTKETIRQADKLRNAL